jgi:signal transduction histidine kinase
MDDRERELEDLRSSRARVVSAADRERRRIERALHDGVQQHLIAVAVNVQLARELVGSDPTAAAALLDEMTAEVHEALEDVRLLARTVYPSLLIDRGLVEALRGVAAEVAIPTLVETTLEGRYPPEVEAAVYFCCVQTLEAFGKARPGAYAIVRADADAETLRVEVLVDGNDHAEGERASLPAETADRIGAASGAVSVSTDPGSTRITFSIPRAPS